MGWNSWYIHYNRVTEEHMRNAADVMIASGMADYGYQYVNIDDCWMKKKGDEPYRDARGAMLPNAKFPDIKGMVDYIHGKGLKAGLYTSPGPWTCGGYVGSYEHERVDAEKFAEWGFDFLKYDWCSYTQVAGGKDLEHLQAALPEDGRHPQDAAARHRLQPVPVRHGRRLELGRRGRRQLLAHDRRSGSGAGRSAAGLLPASA